MQWMDRARAQGHWTLNGGWCVLAYGIFGAAPRSLLPSTLWLSPQLCTLSSVSWPARLTPTEEAARLSGDTGPVSGLPTGPYLQNCCGML